MHLLPELCFYLNIMEFTEKKKRKKQRKKRLLYPSLAHRCKAGGTAGGEYAPLLREKRLP